MKKFQLKIEELKEIIKIAENKIKNNASLSTTLTFESFSKSKTHLGNDDVVVALKSGYSECNNTYIYDNK